MKITILKKTYKHLSNLEQADCDDQLSKSAVYILTGTDILKIIRRTGAVLLQQF